jgi:glucose-1-phosphate thymidylyltransferase
MKGIILAGGTGTRLHPVTLATSKQLVPVYDKPMIYYPLATLMRGGIRDVLVITTPADQDQFARLLGDGGQWGISVSYAVQPRPEGVAQALVIAAEFAGGEPVALILGDNIFAGPAVEEALRRPLTAGNARILAYPVANPGRYGVVELDQRGRPLSLEEKPADPRSNLAVTGLYLLSGNAPTLAKGLTPSRRGELEITDVLAAYLRRGALEVTKLDDGTTWFDTGTFDGLLEASDFVRAVESRTGTMLGCVEEVAWCNGWIDDEHLAALANTMSASAYGRALAALLDRPRAGPEKS